MKTDLIEKFRKRLSEGYVLGPFSKTSDPAFIEAMGHTGFDFVIIDLEHGPNTIQTAQGLIRAAEVSGTLPIVRVKEGAPWTIGEALDVGAGGVQIPQVRNAADARGAVERARFAPEGSRGVCRFVRAADYSSMDRFDYFKAANRAVIILQVEGTEALGNMDEILAVPGIDVIFIGPYDLSQSLGVPGDIENEIVLAEMRTIVAQCLEAGLAVGTFVDTIDQASMWRSAGVQYLSYSADVGLFTDRCREVVRSVRESTKQRV